MTVAEIHGKISETSGNVSERMEDLLTSDVFGPMRYLRPQEILIPFLETAKSEHGDSFPVLGETVKIHCSFWPSLKSPGCIPCEPDVLLGLETDGSVIDLVLIEAKYYSGLSSEEDERPEPNDQLARELDNLCGLSSSDLGWTPGLRVGRRWLLFVTQDMGMPHGLLAQSLAAYRRKRKRDGDIYWTSWRFLPSILEQALEKGGSPQSTAVLEDMLQLLLRKGLTVFRGMEPIREYLVLPEFYHSSSRSYTWPDIPDTVRIDYTYEVTNEG